MLAAIRTLFSISMIGSFSSLWPRRLSCPLWLFLATRFFITCLASASSTTDVWINGLSDSGPVVALDPLLLDSHTSILVIRQSNESVQLDDNSVVTKDISPGTADFWTFSPSFLNISGPSTLYITVSACTQPFPKVGLNATQIYTSETLPPLQLYVSADSSNPRPGPTSDSSTQTLNELSRGFTNNTVPDVSNDVFISVVAPNISSNWQGTWSYQLATSTKEPLQNVISGENLFVIDTSQTNALITTGNLSTSATQPFQVYAVPNNSDYVFSSLSKSFCVFNSNPSLLTNTSTQVSMTTRGVGGLPKQQFFLGGLNASTLYNIYLTLPSNITTHAGTVFSPSMSIKTKTNDNCQLVFDLPFCTETAYAAPANSSVFNSTGLANFYDTMASQLYANFSVTMQLYPCNRSLSAQYSLIRNCTTCLAAYKNWLCAVTIPRCADVTDNSTYLYNRPVNQSRNPQIDQVIQPGPYKEVLPCGELCYGVEQNCPSTLGFQCPRPKSFGLQNSYGDSTDGLCNAPELQYLASRGGKLEIGIWMVGFGILVHMAFWILLGC